jgi:SAM-dependent methyltransferase
MKIDLGCGNRKVDGSIGIDRVGTESTDIIADINNSIPVEAESADVVYCNHILEHVDSVLGVIEDIHRVLKRGGVVKIKVPYCLSMDAFTDPTHRHFFTERSLDYFDEETDLGRSMGFYTACKFKILSKKLNPIKRYTCLLPKFLAKRLFLFNEIEIVMMKL